MRSITGIFFASILFLGAQAHAILIASPGSVDFGQVQVGSFGNSESVSIINESSNSLTLFVSGYCGNGIEVEDLGCSYLSSYGSCTLDVTFSPESAGYYSCNININSTMGDFATVSVFGQAVAPPAPAPAVCKAQ